MRLQLERLRRAKGYKSRGSFAEAIGVNPSTYKSWETGLRAFSFKQACMLADFLGCSLDELAGRFEYVGRTHDGSLQRSMNAHFASLSEDGRAAAEAAVVGIAMRERAREQKNMPDSPVQAEVRSSVA